MNSLIHKTIWSWRTLFWGAALSIVFVLSAYIGVTNIDNAHANSGGHLITIHDRDTDKVIISNANTIGNALKEANISIDKNDLVEPALTETIIAPEYHINIYRARPVTVIDDNVRMTIITAYQTAAQIAQAAGVNLYPEDKAVFSRESDITKGFGEQLTIIRSVQLEFTIYGKTSQIRTQSKTVSEMLLEKGIKLEQGDRVEPALDTAISSGLVVKLWREGKQTQTVEEPIDFDIETTEDANRDLNYRVIQSAGEKGLRSVTYEVVVINGKEASRKEIVSIITKQPIKQIEVIGVLGKYTTPSENESITWDYLINQGFSRIQTAGIMGNLMQEHGFQTSDTKGGLGIVQWTGGRRDNLMARDNWDNIYVQLDFLMTELSGGYVGVKNQILASSSLIEVVRIFQNQFERCGICLEGKRITYAQNILASH